MKFNMKAVLALSLLFISALMLFVPVVDGAGEIKTMIVLLTGLAIRDYFAAEAQTKNLAAVKEAYDPTPAKPYVPGEGE